ncbi:MAG TPA: ATP-binding protein [Steroidobacteraceae bacterium]|nr:ATP-binding protein [Steroidobacteraceae bacterium]
MKSLRKRLLAWLVPVFLTVAVISTVWTYYMFGSMVSWFMDNQMRVLADSHAAETVGPPTLRSLTDHSVDKGDLIIQIWDAKGGLLASSYPSLALPLQSGEGFKDVRIGSRPWRVYVLHTPERTVQSVQCLQFRSHVINKQALQAGLPIALLIPISAWLVWFGICGALRRLSAVARVAAAQDENTIGELPTEGVPSEIKPLVTAVNTLLARLRDAFASQRRFVQDAAHELRTPITAMTLQLENVKACVKDAEVSEQVAQFEAGLKRTKRLIEQLLRLARQEATAKADAASNVELEGFLRELISDLMPCADHRSIDLGLSVDVAATVRANPHELRSLLHNLLDNALRYSPDHGVVDVRLFADGGTAVVEIADTGPGIPVDLLPRVFDRFFRIEGTDTEGSGLGLAIAKHAADRNHIDLRLTNRTDRSGLVARTTFSAATLIEGAGTEKEVKLSTAA